MTQPTERDRTQAKQFFCVAGGRDHRDIGYLACLFAAAREEGRREEQRWQPIETAPKNGIWLLMFGDGPGFASCSFIGYYGLRSGYDEPALWRNVGWRAEPVAPTHWMPLPEPPRENATVSDLSGDTQDIPLSNSPKNAQG